MSRDNILFTLVGVGFGLFFGFLFVTWANQRPVAARTDPTQPTADARSSITVADESARRMLADASQRARANQNDFDAQMEAGRVTYQARQYDDALEFFLQANRLRPEENEPVVQLGNVNIDAGHFEAAEKWYTAALLKEPDNINVRTDLGLTFLLREPPDYERALKEFRASLTRDPNHEPTLQNLIYALSHKGERAEARAALQRLEEINPANPAIAQLRAGLQ